MGATIDIHALEGFGMSVWPALRTVHDRGWVWRWADGYTKRSNCLQVMDERDGQDAEARLDTHLKWFAKYGTTPTVRMTPLIPDALNRVLDERGWNRFEHSVVLYGEPDDEVMARNVRSDGSAFLIEADPEEADWIDDQCALSESAAVHYRTLTGIVRAIALPKCGLTLKNEDGEPIASTLVVCDGATAALTNVVVGEAMRKQGHGRRIVACALDWARRQGARHAAIKVLEDNATARCIYESFGLKPAYAYHYRRPPAGVVDL